MGRNTTNSKGRGTSRGSLCIWKQLLCILGHTDILGGAYTMPMLRLVLISGWYQCNVCVLVLRYVGVVLAGMCVSF